MSSQVTSSGFLTLDPSTRPLLRRRFTLTLKPRLRTDLRKKLVCRVKTAETSVGPTPRLNSDDSRVFPLSTRNIETRTRTSIPRTASSEAKGVDGAKMLVGGAAAAAMAAAGIQLGQQVVHAVDSVPVIANLELLLGTAVTAKSILSYLGDRRTRAKVDAKLTSLLDTLNSAFASKSQNKTKRIEGSKTRTERQTTRRDPSMLEVELRSLVDNNQVKPENQLAVTVDRPTFIGTVADFIRTRERKNQEVQESLEQNLDLTQSESKRLLHVQEVEGETEDKDATEAIKQSLLELQKSKSSRRASAGAAAALAKLQQVQQVQQQIKEEKSKGLKEVTGLKVELGSLSASAKELTLKKDQERTKLSEMLGVAGLSAQADIPGPSPELEEKLQTLKKLQRSFSSDLSTEVALPRTKMAALQERLTCLEMQLQVVTESRDSLLHSNDELHRRVAKITEEKHSLAVRVHELEGTLAKTRQNMQGVSLGGKVLALESQVKGVRKPDWNKQAALEEELRLAKESQSKYQGAMKWLTLQLRDAQDLDKEAQFRSSLEFAEKRAHEEDERVASIQARIQELDFKTLEKQSVLSERVAKLEATATKLAIKEASASSPVLRPATHHVMGLKSTRISSTALLEPAAAQRMSSTEVGDSPFNASSAAAAASDWLKNISAKMNEGKRKKTREPLVPPMTTKEMRTYGRAIYPAFVARNGSSEEKEAGMELLIKDLVKKGAEEEWARDLVMNQLVPAANSKKGAENSS